MDLNRIREECCIKVRNLPCQEERLFPCDSEYSVFIQHVEEDGALWVMLQSELQIMEIISDALNCIPTQEKLSKPVLNQAVSALNEDSVRYRAVIKRTEPDICVQFIDFGDELVVSPENLAPLPATLSVIQPLAMKVNLPVDSTIIPIVGECLLMRHVKTDKGVVTVDAVLPNPVVMALQTEEHLRFPMCGNSDVSGNACAKPGENDSSHDQKPPAPLVQSDSQLESIEDFAKLAPDEKIEGAGESEPQEVFKNLEASAIPVPLERDGDEQCEGSKENLAENVATDSPVIVDAGVQSQSDYQSFMETVLDKNPLLDRDGDKQSEIIKENLVEDVATDSPVIVDAGVQSQSDYQSFMETVLDKNPLLDRDGDKRSESNKENLVDNMATDSLVIVDAGVQSHSVSQSVLETILDNAPLPVKSLDVAGTVVNTTLSEEGEFQNNSKGSSVADSEDLLPPLPQSDSVSTCKKGSEKKDHYVSQEDAHESLFDPLISALGRYPHLGGGYAQEIAHSNGYLDMGGAGDGRVSPNVNRNPPRKITKGRNSPNFRPFSPQPNSRPVPPQNDLHSSPKLAPQKIIRSESPQDFKTILEFELSIIREQNRLQMLQLQKKMEKDLALNMKMVKDELAEFRNEVHGKLYVLNDTVVHKLADIYSDIAMLKNEQELKRDPAVCSGQVHQYQSTQSHSKQSSYSTKSQSPPESTNIFKSNQLQYNDNHHGNPNFVSEFQLNTKNQYQRQALETFRDKDTNNKDSSNLPANRLMSQRKEKMMDRDNPQRQQSNFSVGQFNPNEYPKVDHFDPSKAGVETDNEPSNKKGSSGCIICVNNLCPEQITPDLLFNLFGVYGNVQRVKISAQDKGRAYIEMADSAQAEEVVRHLNNVQLMGSRLHVTRCSFERLNLSRQEFQSNMCKDFTKPQLAKLHRYHFIKWDAQKLFPPSSKLMLSNVLTSVTDDKIKGEFSKNGFHIQNISNQVCSNEEKKLVFITFSSVEEAVNALTIMHLKELSDWMMMRISFAKL